MALKRSAGLETVACWQTDAQWIDPEVRPQLDALFAHRVYFATASAEDARAATDLMMAAYSDQVRSVDHELPILGSPDVRLHLPKHYALASWVTPEGRQPTFIAQTAPVAVDPERIAWHHQRQLERGGRELESFRQPHWDRDDDRSEEPDVEAHQLSLAAVGTDPRPGRATHRSDPTGERERDDFAELRELLRSEAAQRTQPAPRVPPPRKTPDAGKHVPEREPPATVSKPPAAEPPPSYAELVAVDEA